jgi:hypothetical protein
LEDISWWCWDVGGDVEGEPPLEEKFLVGLECKADILGKGCASHVVRSGREGDVDSVPFERKDDYSYLEKGRFVAVIRAAKDGGEAGYERSFADLAKREALD